MAESRVLIGTAKFRETGAFPLDPGDLAALRAGARADAINIYLRLWDESGFIRTVVVIDSIQNLSKLWDMFCKERGTTPDDLVELKFADSVYRVFGRFDPPTPQALDAAKLAIKLLGLYHIPNLRSLKRTPDDNIVGMILEYRDRQLENYCYCQFPLDVTPERFH